MRPEMTKLLIGMPRSQADWLRESSARKQMTVSEFVRMILREKMEKVEEVDNLSSRGGQFKMEQETGR